MVARTTRQETELAVEDLKMLRFSLGVTKMDRIKNNQRDSTRWKKLERPDRDGLDMCRGGQL